MYIANFSFMENCVIGSVSGLTLWNGGLFSERLMVNDAAWFLATKEEAEKWSRQAIFDSMLGEIKPAVNGIRLSVAIPILFYMKGLYRFTHDLYGSGSLGANSLGVDSYSIREIIRQDFIELSYDLPFNGILVSEGNYLLWNFNTYSVFID